MEHPINLRRLGISKKFPFQKGDNLVENEISYNSPVLQIFFQMLTFC